MLITENGAAAHTRPVIAESEARAEICVSIRSHADILEARRRGRELGRALGFSSLDCILIAAAISELARNILLYAQHGEIRLRPEALARNAGIEITAADPGPGIGDVGSAIPDERFMSDSLGLGLPGVKRIMDDFEIVSKPGRGANVTVRKWRSQFAQPRSHAKKPRATNGAALPGKTLDE